MIMMLIYIDDILIIGPNSAKLEEFIHKPSSAFGLKDLGKLAYFLSIEVLYSTDCVYLSQRKYIRDLLCKVDMLNCKCIDTPMSAEVKLRKEIERAFQYIAYPTHYGNIVRGM